MTTCHLVLTKELGISENEFVALWQADLDAARTATATLETLPPQDYASPEAMIVLSFLGGFAGGVISDTIKEILKEKIIQFTKYRNKQTTLLNPPSSSPSIEILEQKLEDGNTLLVVVIKEKSTA